MNISFRPMDKEEAWDFIKNRHHSFHCHLKKFGYGYKSFVPNNSYIHEMFKNETLNDQNLSDYCDIFKNKIYNKKELQKFDKFIKTYGISALECVSKTFKDNIKDIEKIEVEFPEKVEILTTYGGGGSYNPRNNQIIFRMTQFSEENIIGLLQHEFVHLLIEEPIIRKYNVPQDLKERIVDIICFEYFGKPVQENFKKSLANKYITRETIENNLIGAVQEMMNEFEANKSVLSQNQK